MPLREALIADIPHLQKIRNSVKENSLSDPALISTEDYIEFLTQRGKGWLFENEAQLITGFAIADLRENNIWALFVHPDHEKQGTGRLLHDAMLNWYFSNNKESAWLSTAPGTRAEKFYLQAGWVYAGPYGKKENRYEMSREKWRNR